MLLARAPRAGLSGLTFEFLNVPTVIRKLLGAVMDRYIAAPAQELVVGRLVGILQPDPTKNSKSPFTYCTVMVSACVLVSDPLVARTVMVMVPLGVWSV